jgi:uncharacterized protein
VQTVLFAYNWPAKSERGRLGQLFLHSLFLRLPDLQTPPRHPKWQEFNLAASVPGWRRVAAVDAWLAQQASSQQEQAFRDFLRWRSSPSATGSR